MMKTGKGYSFVKRARLLKEVDAWLKAAKRECLRSRAEVKNKRMMR